MWLSERQRPRRGQSAPTDQDAGFTLIEIMVALAMATVILTAFAYTATAAVRAVTTARLNQQGADVATQRIEEVRAMPWGTVGHDPAGIAPDPALSGDNYNGEPLVKLAGGLSPQITTVTENDVTYTVYTYITKPADATVTDPDNRRVTVVVTWVAYGQPWSRTMSTIVTLTQRGLPLPEYKLTQVGPSSITVNPGAVVAFGYQLSNQGAPDQWNITTSLSGVTFYFDNGDGLYNAGNDTTLVVDNNGDGIPDTGRLEPKESVIFWAVRTVPSAEPDGTTPFTVTARPASVESGSQATVESTLIVTSGVITPTVSPSPSTSTSSPTPSPSASNVEFTKCAAANPAPTPAGASGYSVKQFALHNSGATSWPTLPLPADDPIPGTSALRPMYFDASPPSIPSTRALPVLSTNLVPASEPGRLLYTGGSFSSTSASQVLDFVGRDRGLSYRNSVVVRLWVRPLVAGTPVKLEAQVYTQKVVGSGTADAISGDVSLELDPFTCDGWQEVWFQASITAVSNKSNASLGVRIWNDGSDKVVAAYDHGAFPATITVVQK